jgi:PKD repeat protein
MKNYLLLFFLSALICNNSHAVNITLLDSIIDDKCGNQKLMVHFNRAGTYNSGNTFRIQLSDNNGNFNNSVIIGTKSATGSGLDSILCSFPQGTIRSDCRIRVLSSNVSDTSRSSQLFTIAYMPKVMFDVNDSSQCQAGHEFVFTNRTDSTTTMVLQFWILGDGGSSITNSPIHKYKAKGTYRVTLYTFTFGNCFDSAWKNVTVFGSPELGFSTNKDSQCNKYHQFVFRDTSNRSITSYTRKWEFGDGTTATDSVVSKKYASPGLYTVRLSISTPEGCMDTVEARRRVFPMPVPGFTIDNTAQCLKPNIFKFTDTTNISIVSYTRQWIFGDATNTTVANPAKHYNGSGIFNPRLIITTFNGCMDTAVAQVTVHPGPIAAYVTDSGSNCTGSNRIVFRNTSSISSGTFNITWKFSDGSSSLKDTVLKSFGSEGVFNAQLIAESNNGCRDTATGKVVIWPTPVAGFSINKAEQCYRNNRFMFGNQSTISSGFLSHQWNFGDNTSSTQSSPTHAYFSVDSFKVRLISSTNRNCRDTITKTVKVREQPKAAFSVNDNIQCRDSNSFKFTNTSTLSSGLYSPTWYFGNGDISFLLSPKYSYTTTGNYTVMLEIQSLYNCRDTAYSAVQVLTNPSISIRFIGDSVVCAGDSIKMEALGGISYLWSNNSTSKFLTVKSSGQITVKGTAANSCPASSAAVNPLVHPLPAKPTITKVGKDSLRSSNTSGNQWYKGSTLLSGATNQYYHYTSKGAYHVVYTDVNGCSNSSDSMVITSLSDLNTLQAGIQPKIYPIPSGSLLNIEFPSLYSGAVQLMDLQGKVLMEIKVNEQSEISFSLEGLSSGIYYLRIGSGVWRIVKE